MLARGNELCLPTSGLLSDGTTVSNYHLLPNEILKSEGWKPLEEVKPTFEESTQMLQLDSVIDEGEKIVATYIAVEKHLSEEEQLENLLIEEMGL